MSARPVTVGRFAARTRAPSLEGWLPVWQRCVAIACVVLLFLELPLYAHVLRPAFLPKLAYFALGAAALPVLAARFDEFVDWLLQPFPVWAMGFMLLDLLHLIAISPGGHPEVVNGVLLRMQMCALAVILGFVLVSLPPASYLRVFPVLAVVLAGLLAFDFAAPWVLYPPNTAGVTPGRAAATLLNANKAGEAIMLITLFGLAVTPRRWRPLLLAVAAVGVIATFGRNAMLAWLCVVIALVAGRAVSGAGAALLFGAGAAGGLLAGALVEFAATSPELARAADDLTARLGFFTSGRADDDSASERLTVALAALRMFVEHPLLGAGVGATYLWPLPVSPHNQPLMLAAESGVFGLLAWGGLLWALWNGRYFAERSLQVVGALLFTFYSMFAHTLFDFPYWLLTFALLSSRGYPQAGAAALRRDGQGAVPASPRIAPLR